ncbi:hypothetical protein Poli38472_001903 [Pythium oligandrum]|uniref:NmrA-like domain-containing protein n=1 Tax=Pythium oligandrum TaxID=41045 RepID=A0A8K1CVM2_PYTOL|nr:hypothetical protein Poli38472_001903 [Pythium oligandrum]|eukprot:TMW69747.1 hypothetical protein Poli38472_001903 [Pythium oligandrum]
MPAIASPPRLLVLGASGRLDQAILRHLLTTLRVDPQRIIVGTREPAKLQELVDQGVEVRRYDLLEEETFEGAIKDASRVLIISTAHDGRANFVTLLDTLAKYDVEHVSYTSFYGVETSTADFTPTFRAAERAFGESKLKACSLLRNGYYTGVTFPAFRAALKTGKWYSAMQSGRVTYTSIDALGLANAVALVGDKPVDQIVSLTGPEALSVEDVVKSFNDILGKTFELAHVSAEELTAHLEEHVGLPAQLAHAMASIDASVVTGDVAVVTNDYEKLVGTSPGTMADWICESKDLLLAM